MVRKKATLLLLTNEKNDWSDGLLLHCGVIAERWVMEIQIRWDGPFVFVPQVGFEGKYVFDQRQCDFSGIYLWTIEYKGTEKVPGTVVYMVYCLQTIPESFSASGARGWRRWVARSEGRRERAHCLTANNPQNG